MNNEEAIKILQDELKHTEHHLNDKNKSEEFYTEMKLYCEAFRLAIKALDERQQGEWRKIGDIGLAYTCNKCGEANVIPTKFCPNCGADMRKGGAE